MKDSQDINWNIADQEKQSFYNTPSLPLSLSHSLSLSLSVSGQNGADIYSYNHPHQWGKQLPHKKADIFPQAEIDINLFRHQWHWTYL